jgi:SAM-dependent methyltransferase
MKDLNFEWAYSRLVEHYKLRFLANPDRALQVAIGGEFEAIGILERELLVYYGLGPSDYLIDVGCGAGRLTRPLAEFLSGKYLGTDVVPELVEYAQGLVQRRDWRFEVVRDIKIPEDDQQADMVCFFSVFTHLLHEHSYRYLREAKRVLKSRGKIIFSCLEFSVPCHWAVFAETLNKTNDEDPLNVFVSRDAIQAWASHLELEVEAIHGGDKAFIPLSRPVVLDTGTIMENLGTLGQSVCVLRPR